MMQINDVRTTRAQRRKELLEMWKDRRGQVNVLSLFHRALPEGESARDGMSMFDVILRSEFGEDATSDEHDGRAA